MVNNRLILYEANNGTIDIPTGSTRFVGNDHLQIYLVNFDAELPKTGDTTTWGNIPSVDVWVKNDDNSKPLHYTLVYQPTQGNFIFEGDGSVISQGSNYSIIWNTDENKLNVETATVAEMSFSGSGGSLLVSPNILTLVGEHKYGYATYTGSTRFSSANVKSWLKNPTSKSFKIFLKEDSDNESYFERNDEDGLDITINDNNGKDKRNFTLHYMLDANPQQEILAIKITQTPLYQVTIDKVSLQGVGNKTYQDLSTPVVINYSTFTANDLVLCNISGSTLSQDFDPNLELGFGINDISLTFDDDSVISGTTELGVDKSNLYGEAYSVNRNASGITIDKITTLNYTANINSVSSGSTKIIYNDKEYPADVKYSSCYIAIHPSYIKTSDNTKEYYSNLTGITSSIETFLQTDKGKSINLSTTGDTLIYIPCIYETTLQAQYIDFELNDIQDLENKSEYFTCDGDKLISGGTNTNQFLHANFEKGDLFDGVAIDENIVELQQEWFTPNAGITCYTECTKVEQKYTVKSSCAIDSEAKNVSFEITPLIQKDAHAAGFNVEPISAETISYEIFKANSDEQIVLIKCDLVLKEDWDDLSVADPLLPLSKLQVKKHVQENQEIKICAQSLNNKNIQKDIIKININCAVNLDSHAHKITNISS